MHFFKYSKRWVSMLLAGVLIFSTVAFSGCSGIGDDVSEAPKERVLLISIDGMRPDAIAQTEYVKYLMTSCAYALDGRTVMPSVTLPCHMSMFYSVPPTEHGVVTNEYTPSELLGDGLTQALAASGKSSAVFYNWFPMGNVAPEDSVVKKEYIGGEVHGWESANTMLGEACIEYLSAEPADFTYLYLGFLDEWGHAYGWMSDEYFYALNESLSLIERVIAALPDGYTVIITTDHGGHDKGHGSELAEDMTIPIFVMGKGYTPGTVFEGASILDIAPTVLDCLGVARPKYWQGKVLGK